MKSRSTMLLAALVVLTLASAIVAIVRLSDARRDALARANDLQLVRSALADISATPRGTLTSSSNGADAQINRGLRAASAAAGALDRLRSVEPGQPARVRDTDFVETPVFVRVDATTLRRIVTLLARLSADDRTIAITSIELSPPATETPSPASEELWTADLTLGYLAYSPRQ
jgi:hypothetical protein